MIRHQGGLSLGFSEYWHAQLIWTSGIVCMALGEEMTNHRKVFTKDINFCVYLIWLTQLQLCSVAHTHAHTQTAHTRTNAHTHTLFISLCVKSSDPKTTALWQMSDQMIWHFMDFDVRWLSDQMIWHFTDFDMRWLSDQMIWHFTDVDVRLLSDQMIWHLIDSDARWFTIKRRYLIGINNNPSDHIYRSLTDCIEHLQAVTPT